MKTLTAFTLFIFTLLILSSCGSDPVSSNNNPNPPTPADSVIKLISPANNYIYSFGDTVKFCWSRSYPPGYAVYTDTLASFSSNYYFFAGDTCVTFGAIDYPITIYWKVMPINKPEFQSETRSFTVQP